MRGRDASRVEHHLLEKQACPVLWVLSSLFLLVVEWEQLDGRRWKSQMTLWSRAHWPRLDYCLRERKNTSLLLAVFQSLCLVRFFAIPWTAAPRHPCPSHLPELAQTQVHRVDDAIQHDIRSHAMPWHKISSYVTPFFSCPQSFLASGSFLSQLFASGGQSIGASVSASVLPMKVQGWFLVLLEPVYLSLFIPK